MFFAEVAAYRIGTRRLMALGMEYSSHADDETDAHAHSHTHEPPLDVDTSAPEHPAHVHPSAIPTAGANDHLVHHHIAAHSHAHVHSHGHSHSHSHGGHSHAHHSKKEKVNDPEALSTESTSSLGQHPSEAEAAAQLVAVAVLEFGVILHSIIIGLTLAVSDEFIILFIVIIFHRE